MLPLSIDNLVTYNAASCFNRIRRCESLWLGGTVVCLAKTNANAQMQSVIIDKVKCPGMVFSLVLIKGLINLLSVLEQKLKLLPSHE